MEITLDQLRAENAQESTAQAPTPQEAPQVDHDEADLHEESSQEVAEPQGEGEQAESDDHSWMSTGDAQETPGAEKKFTDRDIGAAKNKLKAKLEERHRSELEQLQAQLEEERRKNSAPQQIPRPRREQFYDHDDPEEAYAEALTDWKINERQAQVQRQEQQYAQQRQQIEAQQRIASGVDQHYERAASLAKASGITDDQYQQADYRVRSAVDGVFPGAGEQITNALIANLGEGSEKVFYSLGVNTKRLEELKDSLKQDPSGLKAMLYLGRLSAELGPQKRTSNAPPPAASAKGDMGTADIGKSLLKRYQQAHKDRDNQTAFSIKREARAKGVDTSTW